MFDVARTETPRSATLRSIAARAKEPVKEQALRCVSRPNPDEWAFPGGASGGLGNRLVFTAIQVSRCRPD